ncbi:uncharacterized protein FOMMEDRAFT_18035 [Fomitiporia mediterranea MF3/22]|uniref:uncharacterized protein n=1 Tax=Fomitiporia mediterranea (strain MF3/22) TaxID=694068 RepID=UPI0004408159|nr:uncharacterized protein FOMMEDRAFT_18035 [Fomitiporia mediterranea MF3/22]EJD05793.1 hypothetical protein FOMMEDRAFT_18035 [Fomitiporia mediterranea MF3/22]
MSDFVLVAPRPRRVNSLAQRASLPPVSRILSPPVEALSRLKLADGEGQPADNSDEAIPSSGRNTASPRLNLPSDALEEFLSILRPSLFSPSSPTFRARRHESGSGLAIPLERPQAIKPRDSSHTKSPSLNSVNLEDGNATTAAGSISPAADVRQSGDNDQFAGNLWRIPGILESPVSRTHTRNPFYRHPSYDTAFSGVLTSHLSPSLLPLPPSPSPAPLSLSPPADAENNDY